MCHAINLIDYEKDTIKTIRLYHMWLALPSQLQRACMRSHGSHFYPVSMAYVFYILQFYKIRAHSLNDNHQDRYRK